SAEAPAEKQQLPFDTLAEAMDAVFDEHMAPASVIFAPPGGGKSTLLRHYQLSQAQHLVEGERLVFYAQLRDYRPKRLPTDEDQDINNPALTWLEAEWRKETRAAPPLLQFIHQGTLTLLLDGLNEIPRRSDEEYRARVGEWRELIGEMEHSHPGVRLLFACRPLDYSQRLDAGRHTRLPEIEVQAMEPERIKDFVDKRFPAAIAAQIWGQLEDHPSLDLYSSPYYLNLLLEQIDTAATDIAVPQNRARLFTGMVRERLRRECQNKANTRFNDPELLSERDRTTISNEKSRGNWLPDNTPFFPALAALAFHIQDASGSNERWGTRPRKKARKAMQAALEGTLPADKVLEAGCDLGLFEDDAAQAGHYRFIHQQMQEYFAAWVLAEQADPERLSVPWRSTDIEESTEALLAQGGDDNLAELAGTGWEESALIAASLSDEPDAYI
ncbi:MAG: NACHT domain-containing protein, partial [Gammaproteobacteria bacterium]|nr:NACHT domain-containing protein [Gammaproteobacteria bacterium]